MEPEKPASGHILRNNLLGVLAAAVVFGALAPLTDGGSAGVFALVYGVQVVVNLILGLVYLVKRSGAGQSPAPYFLSALLVLLIGFGACSFMVMSSLGNMH